MVIISSSRSLDVEIKRIESFGHIPKIRGKEAYEICFTDGRFVIIEEDLMLKGLEQGDDVFVVIENAGTENEIYKMVYGPVELDKIYFKTLN